MNHTLFAKQIWEQVPAYRSLVGATFPEQFTGLPLINKHNYLLSFPMTDLCRPGSLDEIHLIGASSGFSKTGAVFWPKRPCDEKDYIHSIENLFVNAFHIDQRKTLCLECLAFGMWIGGMQLATAIRMIGLTEKYRFTIATPGLDLRTAVEVIEAYHKRYDQIMIITNPSNIPIITALLQSINPSTLQALKGKVYFPVVGEYFSEAMREHICREYGHDVSKTEVLRTGYGSADTGEVSFETERAIYIRKFFSHRPELSKQFFGTEDTPMMLEFNPAAFVEIIDGHIVVTKDQFIPLVRYDTNDCGGILHREDLRGIVPDNLLDPMPEKWMYVMGRADNAVIFYGTNLMVGEIQQFLLGLDKAEGYGGLYTVHEQVENNISTFEFVVYTRGEQHADAERFKTLLVNFLCGNSNEFAFKYHNLSKSSDLPLISVRTADISNLQGNLKHRFII
ncbi:MAG: hypothetical protein MJZ92_04595 [Paludibacteraceae bacterium]|nr:hypothetical protein [Paludibacteraceae bacterium]